MKHADIRAMMAEVAPVIKEYTAAALVPVTVRLDALEKRLDELPTAADVRDAHTKVYEHQLNLTSEFARELTEIRAVAKTFENPPVPPDPLDISAMVDERVEEIVEHKMQYHRAGQDKAIVHLVTTEVEKAVEKDADMDAIVEIIGQKVTEAFAGVQLPKDGRDGRDGLDAVEFLRAADGHLVVTMSNGTTRDLGQVNGKDGEPGRDGFGFDDMKAEYDGERTLTLVFTKGEHVQRFPFVLPIVLDRGVYKDGETYAAGDGVTWGGSFWIAQAETSDKPDGGKGWRLAVKRGRDGKDGILKPPSEPKPLKVG